MAAIALAWLALVCVAGVAIAVTECRDRKEAAVPLHITEEQITDLSRYSINVESGTDPRCVIGDAVTGTTRICRLDASTWRLRDWPAQIPDFVRERAETKLTLALTREGGIRA